MEDEFVSAVAVRRKTNKTKIVATLGGASCSRRILERMLQAGVDVFRLNFSHGTHEWHAEAVALIRQAGEKLGVPTCILQDLQGPKIRLGDVKGQYVDVYRGHSLIITTESVIGNDRIVSTDYLNLVRDVRVGQVILISDGKIELKVEDVRATEVRTRVVHGGVLKSRQGLNLPDTITSLSSFTEKDKKDLSFGLSQGVDWVALSFVRRARDVLNLKEEIKRSGFSTRVIAKIEKPEAVRHAEKIIQVSDGLMLARGRFRCRDSDGRGSYCSKECGQALQPVRQARHHCNPHDGVYGGEQPPYPCGNQ